MVVRERRLLRESLLAGVLAPAALAAQEPAARAPVPSPVVVEKGLGEALDREATALSALGFNGSVLIAKDGQVILCKGYGLANREKELANGPDTLFDIASLTKQFTAAAILKLEEQEKLETSDLLSKYVGEAPKDKAAITLHHLLTHTSGLPREVPVGASTTERDALVKTALATALRSKPGREFCYANANYELLGAVVEIASGQRFEDYVREQLFRPAGLERTWFLQDAAVDAASAACGYEKRGVFPAQDGWYSWGLRGAGGVLTSVVELERWWRALDGGKVLGKRSLHELFAPELLDYACGWWVREDQELGRRIEHGGVTRGFESSFTCYPERKLLVIVLSNELETCRPTAWTLGRTAAGLGHGDIPRGVALAPEKIEQCAGTFVTGKNAEITVRAVGSRLALQLSPEAVVLLQARREVKTLSRDPELAERIAEIVRRTSSGDVAGLGAMIATDNPTLGRYMVDLWRGWCAERGVYVRHELLGTAREGDHLVGYVRFDFETGSLVLSMSFRDERWTYCVIDAAVPSGPALLAQSENEFLWRDQKNYGSDMCLAIFERDARGRATELTLRTKTNTLQAKRKK